MQQGISIRSFARRIGLSHAYVHRLVRRGTLPTLANGKLDPAACERALARKRQGSGPRGAPARLAPPVPSAAEEKIPFSEAERRKVLAEARIRELKLAQLAGQLVAVADAQKAMEEFAAEARARLLVLPAKLAQRIGGPDRGRIQELATAEIRALLHDLAGQGSEN
jgi:hypothetical protein